MSDNDIRPYDIVLFGATGFTGGLAADYLSRNAPPQTRWAIAGRSQSKLDALRARLSSDESPCPPTGSIRADVSDPASLAAMASSARVVITTVGPYKLHGEPVVRACVEQGADYVDLSGEQDFVDDIRERFGPMAQDKGLRLVPCCGFDSVPHDLGAYFTRKLLPADVPVRMEGFVWTNGSFSGGTWHSAVRAMGRMPALRKEHSRRRRETAGDESDRQSSDSNDRKVGKVRERIRYEPEIGSWVVPLPTIDPAIVLQSARSLDEYGPDFRYGHYVKVPSLPKLAGLLGGVGSIFLLAQTSLTRSLLLSFKSSGEGPSAERRARSRFSVTFIATSGNLRAMGEVSGGDPGYDETAKMISEAALSLAFDRDRLPRRAGVLTPVEAFEDRLIERLSARGMKFRVL